MTTPPVSADFRAAFGREAGPGGRLNFAQFMALALYDQGVGYYRRESRRIGYGAGTDFFTATTSGPIFGEAIVAACMTLLAGENPGEFTFVEIGAEPERGVLAGV